MSFRRFGGGDLVAVALIVSLAMAYGAVHDPLIAIGLLVLIVFAGWVVMRPDLVLLVVVAALPWQDKLQYPNATLSVVKLLGLALVAAYFLRAVRQNDTLRLGPILGFALAFGLIIGFALIASPEPSVGLQKAFRYVFFILFLFLMIQLVDNREQAVRLLRVLVGSAAAASLYGIAGFVGGTVERASGPIADPNDFAYMMAALIPFALFLCAEDRRWRLVWVASTLLLLGATFATLSRGAVVGLAALLLWAIITRRIGIGGTVAIAVAAVLIVVAAFTFWASTVEERLTEKNKIAAANTESRAAFWAAAEEMWEDHPVFGVGPGRFPVEAKHYVKNSPIELEDPITHNSYIEILVEAGPLALLLFLGMLSAAWLGATKAERLARSRRDRTTMRLAAAAKGSLLVAIVSGFFLSEQIAPPFWIACALIGSGALYVASERKERVGGEPGRARQPCPPPREGRRVRVLLATSLHGGGPVEHALTLAGALAAAGVEVEATCGDTELAERFAAAGASAHVLPLERTADPAGAKKLAELARGVDVVHAQDRRTGLLTRLWRPDGTPRVYTVHGLPDPYLPIPANVGRRPGLRNQLAYRGLDAWLARRSDALVVASQALAEQLSRRLGFPADRMEVIPNGVEPVPTTTGGELVASISMLEPVKGLDAFVRAAATLGDIEGARFEIVGSGPAAEDLRELATSLGAPIEFPGHVPAPEVLPRLRVFVLTSWFENCPMALLEAMMAGVPAVVTGVGGVPELVADTAMVVPPGDPEALAAALRRLLEDPELAADLGARARARALMEFTAERNAKSMIDLYERIV